MNAVPKSLCLFTSSYPIGKYESFIKDHLAYLSEKYEKVYIFPYGGEGEIRTIPSNVEVVQLLNNKALRSTFSILFTYWGLVAKLILSALVMDFRIGRLRRLRFDFALLKQHISQAEILEKWILEQGEMDFQFYSVWFVNWATVLSILKDRGIVPQFFCRAHGYDLYLDRNEYAYIPFRHFHFEQVSRLYCISKHGVEYLHENYPRYRTKIRKNYLGVPDQQIDNPLDPDRFVLVSASYLTPVKRVQLIVDILKYIPFKMDWIHFGDGPLEKMVRERATELPANVSVSFKGRVPNKELMEFYSQNPVNLFINVSDSEGLPISMMEVISFGIPIIATDVGGVAEIITDRTGLLISPDFDPEEVSKQIDQFRTSEMNTIEFRRNVRQYFTENFDGKRNIDLFIEDLTN